MILANRLLINRIYLFIFFILAKIYQEKFQFEKKLAKKNSFENINHHREDFQSNQSIFIIMSISSHRKFKKEVISFQEKLFATTKNTS